MKKTHAISYRRSVALFLAVALASTGVMVPTDAPASFSAAEKPKLQYKKGSYLPGETEEIKILNVKKKKIKKLTVTSSDKGVATGKKSGKTAIIINTKKAGKATIRVKLSLKNKKKYNLKYAATVKNTLDRKTPLWKVDGTTTEMTLRYFADTPHVPYVRITDYYAQLSGGATLNVQEKGDGEYLLTTPGGMMATVNTNTDVLESDDIGEFMHVFPPEEGEKPINDDYGGAPFLQPLPNVVLRESKHLAVSYADYGLDLLADTNDIWLPFDTAANTFWTGYAASIAYTGYKLYHYTNYITVTDIENQDFYVRYFSMYPDGKRPADLVDYTYRELMFMLDTQYGNPGRCYFSEAIKEKGMDRALAETDDQTRAVREMLKSSSLEEYLWGLGILADMMDDGGHTQLDYFVQPVCLSLFSQEDYSTDRYIEMLKEEAAKIGYKLRNKPDTYWPLHDAIEEQKGGWKEFDYHESGDTAVYTMGAMRVDPDAWNTYYEKGGDIPSDSYGLFMKYLKKASENKAIKNFVIDLTSNTGGDINVLSGMMQIIVGSPSSYMEYVKTGKRIECPYNVDTNLDGKFDEKDKEVKYPFRFAVLITKCAFSCGNLFPYFAKSYGVMVLGQTSGGGSCAINCLPLGDGLPCYISSNLKCSNRDFVEIDGGVTPDKEIEIKKKADGSDDYSAFFDIPLLSTYINEFYDKKAA